MCSGLQPENFSFDILPYQGNTFDLLFPWFQNPLNRPPRHYSPPVYFCHIETWLRNWHYLLTFKENSKPVYVKYPAFGSQQIKQICMPKKIHFGPWTSSFWPPIKLSSIFLKTICLTITWYIWGKRKVPVITLDHWIRRPDCWAGYAF